jgi:hypothetical protein
VEALKVRPMPGEEVAVSGDGTPTGALAEHGETMAAGVAVAALGDGDRDRNNAEADLRVIIKIVFFVFFFNLLQDEIVCQPTDGFFYIFFLTCLSWHQARKKEVLLPDRRRFFPLMS